MSQTTKKLLADALKLSAKARAELAERLIASLDEDDGLDAAIEEAERRWHAYKEGKIKGIAVGEVFPNLECNDDTPPPRTYLAACRRSQISLP